VVTELAGGGSDELWLDWELLPGLGAEDRLSRLCRWALDAHGAALVWGLRLPGLELPPARGPEHRQRCLTALAEFRP
jgi:uncharacterized protein (DUF58 family)